MSFVEPVVLSGTVSEGGFVFFWDGLATFESFPAGEQWPATSMPSGSYVVEFQGDLSFRID